MITGKQRSFLKSLANTMDSTLQIGKNGITENLIKQVDEDLESKELIKINLLNNSMLDTKDVARELTEKTNSEFVQNIGNKIEIDREDISYTIDTIKKLKEISEDDFHMIIGGDSLLSLHSWKGFEKIISEVNIIVADRYGACGDKIIAEIGRLNEETGKKIISIDTPIIDISSTEIRNKLKMGKSIKYLLPEKVENYILKRGLYSE
jgi:RNA-binding protein